MTTESPKEDEPLRVSASGNAQALASAIAHAIYEKRQTKLRAVGAGATNQAIKAIAIARGFVAPRGMDLICVPGFTTVPSRDGDISAVVITVEVR
jgi:stage V sporulation protein S